MPRSPYDIPDECGGGTLFSDLARWAMRQPARWVVVPLIVATVIIWSLL